MHKGTNKTLPRKEEALMMPLHLEVHQRTLDLRDSLLNPGSSSSYTLRDDYHNIATGILISRMSLIRFTFIEALHGWFNIKYQIFHAIPTCFLLHA